MPGMDQDGRPGWRRTAWLALRGGIAGYAVLLVTVIVLGVVVPDGAEALLSRTITGSAGAWPPFDTATGAGRLGDAGLAVVVAALFAGTIAWSLEDAGKGRASLAWTSLATLIGTLASTFVATDAENAGLVGIIAAIIAVRLLVFTPAGGVRESRLPRRATAVGVVVLALAGAGLVAWRGHADPITLDVARNPAVTWRGPEDGRRRAVMQVGLRNEGLRAVTIERVEGLEGEPLRIDDAADGERLPLRPFRPVRVVPGASTTLTFLVDRPCGAFGGTTFDVLLAGGGRSVVTFDEDACGAQAL